MEVGVLGDGKVRREEGGEDFREGGREEGRGSG